MKMPGFTAEATLYQTGSHYRQNAKIGSPNDETTVVVPQACSWWEWIVCGTHALPQTLTCMTGCVAAAPWGTSAWEKCVQVCLDAHGFRFCGCIFDRD